MNNLCGYTYITFYDILNVNKIKDKHNKAL